MWPLVTCWIKFPRGMVSVMGSAVTAASPICTYIPDALGMLPQRLGHRAALSGHRTTPLKAAALHPNEQRLGARPHLELGRTRHSAATWLPVRSMPPIARPPALPRGRGSNWLDQTWVRENSAWRTDRDLGHGAGLLDRGKAVAEIAPEETGDAVLAGELGDIGVEVHAVEALQFEEDVIAVENSSGGWQFHGGPGWAFVPPKMEAPPHVGKHPAFGPRGPTGATARTSAGTGTDGRATNGIGIISSEAGPQTDDNGNRRLDLPLHLVGLRPRLTGIRLSNAAVPGCSLTAPCHRITSVLVAHHHA